MKNLDTLVRKLALVFINILGFAVGLMNVLILVLTIAAVSLSAVVTFGLPGLLAVPVAIWVIKRLFKPLLAWAKGVFKETLHNKDKETK